MPTLTDYQALERAIDILKVGLQSGAIKMSGSAINNDPAKRNAEADALYAETFINAVQAAILKAKQ